MISMNILSLKKRYKDSVAPLLSKELGRTNALSLTRITKVVVNVGTGKSAREKDKLDEVLQSLAVITGQKPVETIARKAISGFKVRQGMPVGAVVTLHGAQMWNFLDRLVSIALPRVRDFQGIPLSSVDHAGNISIGIKEHTVFPEISPEKTKYIFSFQVIVVTTAQNRQEGEMLFRALGFPLTLTVPERTSEKRNIVKKVK